MTYEDRVVVIVEMAVYPNATPNSAAVQFEAMGMAAYGDTVEEATAKLRRLFAAEIALQREAKTLEKYLNGLGVTWEPEKDYAKKGLPYEDAVPSSNPCSAHEVAALTHPGATSAEDLLAAHATRGGNRQCRVAA